MTFPRGWELIVVVAVIVLLFGTKKLPDAARGIGRSLRIFKSEMKSMQDDDTTTATTTTEEPEQPKSIQAPETEGADTNAAASPPDTDESRPETPPRADG